MDDQQRKAVRAAQHYLQRKHLAAGRRGNIRATLLFLAATGIGLVAILAL
jgi:hypothetical protein